MRFVSSWALGAEDGALEGMALGAPLGMAEGAKLGAAEGLNEGANERTDERRFGGTQARHRDLVAANVGRALDKVDFGTDFRHIDKSRSGETLLLDIQVHGRPVTRPEIL